ncbi:MAG: hypothetical protein Q9M94_03780 [Candidatus Gracilibacteria bacterium]|nr:hypothetical protein [Candidatus Gracilibacteria bacterium]
MKKILLFLCLIFISLLNIETNFAGFVPGTIAKQSLIGYGSCNSEVVLYDHICAPYGCTGTGCTGAIRASYINYGDKTINKYFAYNSGGYRALTDDTSYYCSVSKTGTYGSKEENGACNGTTIYTGTNGTCNNDSSIFKNIFNIDQYGNFTSESNTYSNLTTCTVEGRVAKKDDIGPVITSNWREYSVNSDDGTWCNIKRYIDNTDNYMDFGEETPMDHLGCDSYSKALMSDDETVDLLEGLWVKVDVDPSGLKSVKIELGKCSGTLEVPGSDNLATIINERNTFIKNITFNYDTSNGDIRGKSIKSLLEMFSVDRLDECLVNGKNYLKVTAKDLARSNADAITLSSNTSIYPETLPTRSSPGLGTINIDNSIPNFKVTGETPFGTVGNGTEGDGMWKNIVINSYIKTQDRYGGDNMGCAGNVIYEDLICEGDRLPEGNWYSPAGVDPKTGEFQAQLCQDNWSFPSTDFCNWECPAGKLKGILCIDGEKPECCETSVSCSEDEQILCETKCKVTETICCSDKRTNSNNCTFTNTDYDYDNDLDGNDSPEVILEWVYQCSLTKITYNCKYTIDGVPIGNGDCSGIPKPDDAGDDCT